MKRFNLPHSELAHSRHANTQANNNIAGLFRAHPTLHERQGRESLSRRLAIEGARRFPAVEKLLPENAKERAGFSKMSMHTGAVQTVQEFSETLHSGYKKMRGKKHKPFMKQEVYNNTCVAINHMGDTTKAGADLVQ